MVTTSTTSDVKSGFSRLAYMDDLIQRIKQGNSHTGGIISSEEAGSLRSHLTWVSDRNRLKRRFLLFGILHHVESWSDYQERLKIVASWDDNDIGSLALALNDSPEVWRLKAFDEWINPQRRSVLTELISELSIHKDKDPLNFFPCPSDEAICSNFARRRSKLPKVFQAVRDFQDMIWRPCGRHVHCKACWEWMLNFDCSCMHSKSICTVLISGMEFLLLDREG